MRLIKHLHTEEHAVLAEEEEGEDGRKQEELWHSITEGTNASEILLLGNEGIKRLYIIKSRKLILVFCLQSEYHLT